MEPTHATKMMTQHKHCSNIEVHPGHYWGTAPWGFRHFCPGIEEKPFCASSPEAATLTDAEFWSKVYPSTEDDYVDSLAWDEFGPAPVGFCLRCGGGLFAEDYQQLRSIIDADQEICDDCADEVTEIPENESWDEIKSSL